MQTASILPTPDVLRQLARYLAGVWTVLGRGLSLWHLQEQASLLPPLAHRRAGRLFAKLQAILALLAEGRLPKTYSPRPKPVPAEAEAPVEAPPPPKPRPPRLPGRIGWLMGRNTEINGAASNLRHWLTDPGVQAILAEIPQARRPLAALCRMLAVPPWPHPADGPLPPPKPRTRKPRPRKPRKETIRELRAWCAATYRNIEIDDGLVKPGRRPWWLPPLRHKRR